jgi:hypothetical protein
MKLRFFIYCPESGFGTKQREMGGRSPSGLVSIVLILIYLTCILLWHPLYDYHPLRVTPELQN